MKTGSDNFRESAIKDIIDIVVSDKIEVIIYEPKVVGGDYQGFQVIKSIAEFKSKADIILANRIDSDLLDVSAKIYTRDIYSRD
jgi:UDPglucose 6-dehydrogenase